MRLRPLTEKIPKALVEVNGEPFAGHQMRLLAASGVRRVVFLVGYRGEMVADFLGDGQRFGLKIEYAFDGPVLLGTAGAIRNALPLLGDAFGVIYGDSYLPCDYTSVERAFVESGKRGLMTVYRNLGQFDASNVEFADGNIVAYDKRNRTSKMLHIDYGLGYFRSSAFDRIPTGQACDLAGLYQTLLAEGQLASFEVPERFYEIGSFAGIEELGRYLSSQGAK